MEPIQLTSEVREMVGTRKVKVLRASGLVPAVVYQKGKATSLTVSAKEFAQVKKRAAGASAIIHLAIKGDQAKKRTVLLKEIQTHPLTDKVLHLDFQEILLTEKIKVKIAVVCRGEAVGVKLAGGVLDQVVRDVEVECLPADIPKGFEVDVAPLKIGDGRRVKDLVAPTGVKILTDAEAMIVHVTAPRAEEAIAPVTPEVTEPEVLKQKKPEEIAAEDAEKAKAKEEAAKEKKEEKK